MPATLSRTRNRVWVESRGAFHGIAPAGMFTDVVVCIPFPHPQLMVSPTTAFTVLGVNEIPAALTR